jgi:hypothetical protein
MIDDLTGKWRGAGRRGKKRRARNLDAPARFSRAQRRLRRAEKKKIRKKL